MRWSTIAYATMTVASGAVLAYVAKNPHMFAGPKADPVLDIRRHQDAHPVVVMPSDPTAAVSVDPAPPVAANMPIAAVETPVAEPTPTPRYSLVPGTTRAEVLAMFGEPTDMLDDDARWIYTDRMIFFEDDVVISWIQGDGRRVTAAAPRTLDSITDTEVLSDVMNLQASAGADRGIYLGSGSIDHPSSRRSSSYSGSRSRRSAKADTTLSRPPRSSFFRQNRRSYSNYHQKPNWLKQWTAYRDYSRTRDPGSLGRMGTRYYSNPGTSSNRRSSR